MTPPAAEPALFTMMSMRPSALAACSMKLLASESLRRSAGTATILRPVALAISAAAASSGSLRRAQIATSTPSLASNSAMPLPMHSLPPVTSAVLPLSLRSILKLSVTLFSGAVRHPAPGFGRGKQIGERGVERGRFLAGDSVTRARNNQQPRGRHRAFEKYAAVEAPVILVADDDQQRRRKLLQVGFQVPQCRPLGLHMQHGQRVALRRMLA